jgi:hypothetical protein
MTTIKKVARICYNDHNWKYPSSKDIKSANKNTYEYISGFGHEEWLFDNEKLIDGYHYAFLQPVNNAPQKYETKKYQIHLYFIKCGAINFKGYVGYIDNVECLTEKQAQECLAYYQKKGWIKQMKAQVQDIDGDTSVIDEEIKTNARLIFNIRFRLKDIHISYSNYKLIANDDVNTKTSRYILVDYKEDFHFENIPHLRIKGKETINTKSFYRTVEGSSTEVSARHRLIQKGVKLFLDKTNIYSKVCFEVDNKDIYAIRKDGINEIFEIKTYNAKRCIREALVQLLEYNHYPNRDSSDILYIVGEDPLDFEDKQYLSFLRNTYNLPIWYRRYVGNKNVLLDKE